jgi:exodeoxyribonuclease-3
MNKMKIILLVGLLIYNISAIGQTSTSSENKVGNNIKVMSYNIWNGFDWGKDKDRQDKMISWITSKKPDVVALQELCGYTEKELSEDAKKWGHNYSLILKEKGYPVGLTSSKPIVLKEKVRDGLWHGMLHAQTWGIDFFVVHLSPSDRDFRYEETKIISEKIKNINSSNYLVLGDFNAHSPFDGDKYLEDDSHLERTKESDAKNEKYNNLLDNQFDYSVISLFLSLPLIDVTQRFVSVKERFTFPSKALIGAWQTKESIIENRVRIDYILASRSMAQRCLNSWVFNGEDITLLSDHYPIMAEFILY